MKKILVLVSFIFAFTSIGAETVLDRAKRKLEEMNKTKPEAAQPQAAQPQEQNTKSAITKDDEKFTIDPDAVKFFTSRENNNKNTVWGTLDECAVALKNNAQIGTVFSINEQNQLIYEEFDNKSTKTISGIFKKLIYDPENKKLVKATLEMRNMTWASGVDPVTQYHRQF